VGEENISETIREFMRKKLREREKEELDL